MKLPPFGKYLANLDYPPKNDVYIFIGCNAWKDATDFQISRPGTMCLPPYHDPSQYKWPVSNCDILVFDTGYCDDNYVEDLALCLLINGANIVRYVDTEQQLIIYKKEF